MGSVKLSDAIVSTGGAIEKRHVNGFKPDFITEGIFFFEIKQWWQISRIVKLDLAFAGEHVIGFITDLGFLKRNRLSLRDWIHGCNRPLALWDGERFFLVGHFECEWRLLEKPLHSFELFEVPF